MFPEIFSQYQLVLETLEKERNNFPGLCSKTCFCYHYGNLKNNNLLPSRQNLLRSLWKNIPVKVFTNILVKRRSDCYFSLNKQKPCHRSISCQSRNVRLVVQSTFDFAEIISNESKRGAVCQIVRLHIELYTEITQSFKNIFTMCSYAVQFFWSESLNRLRKCL